MNEVKQLSRLLNAVDEMLNLLDRFRKTKDTERKQQRVMQLHTDYEKWFQECCAVLPEDLQDDFIKAYNGSEEKGTGIKVHLEQLVSGTGDGSAYYFFRDDIKSQKHVLFIARRRLTTSASAVPHSLKRAIAEFCTKNRKISTIDRLFIQSGCEPRWWTVPFQEEEAERAYQVFGWFDGLLLYAPDQEIKITQIVCETLLASRQLPDEVRAVLEQYLNSFQAQPRSLQSMFDFYTIHPRVRQVADSFIATGHYREAILNVFINLNDTVKIETGRSDLDGTDLMRQVMSPRNPLLRFSVHQGEQQGHMDLYAGSIMAIRNPRAHRPGTESDLDEVMELLLFASLLFRLLDKAERVTPP